MEPNTTFPDTPPNSPAPFNGEIVGVPFNFNIKFSYYREQLVNIVNNLPINMPNKDEELKIYILFRQTDEMKRIIKKIEGLMIMYNLNI